MRAQLGAFGTDELELLADRLRELDDLEAEPGQRRRQLGELRPKRDPQTVARRRRVAERDRAPPRSPADELCRQRELPHSAVAALRPGEEPVEECPERPAERQLVGDRFGKIERLHELGRNLPRADLAALLTSRQAPGPPTVRPQSFGNGG